MHACVSVSAAGWCYAGCQGPGRKEERGQAICKGGVCATGAPEGFPVHYFI